MALLDNDTQTASIATEHSLYVDTTVRNFIQGGVDLAAMAADDELEIRVYAKFKSGGTKRKVFEASYKHDQGDIGCVTPPMANAFEWEMTLNQKAGTGRDWDWWVCGA